MALNPAWTLDSEAPEVVESADVVVKVRQALLTLREREERAIRLRYFEGATYQEIGDALDVGVERARQITEKALRKLKHPSRSRALLAAFVGTLPRTSAMPPAEPAMPPSEAQELALRLRELQAHIDKTKLRQDLDEMLAKEWRAKAEWDRVERERKAEIARKQAAWESELRIIYRAQVSELRKLAKQNKRVGGYGYGDASGHFIRIVRKNVNIGSGDTAIRMQVGELWEVNDYWMQTLLTDNLADYVFGWGSFLASHK